MIISPGIASVQPASVQPLDWRFDPLALAIALADGRAGVDGFDRVRRNRIT
jgi:hypothetical protein